MFLKGTNMGSRVTYDFAIISLLFSLASGCSPDAAYQFDALDLAPPQEELSEFALGQYSIPIPIVEEQTVNGVVHRNKFQIAFELHALVRPERKSTIADDWARHEGQIRDHVIRVCRNATVEELQEPELSTLKARLIDVLAAKIGNGDVRQLLITEVVSQRL
jgi:flagellar basal body-associated protein FliL